MTLCDQACRFFVRQTLFSVARTIALVVLIVWLSALGVVFMDTGVGAVCFPKSSTEWIASLGVRVVGFSTGIVLVSFVVVRVDTWLHEQIPIEIIALLLFGLSPTILHDALVSPICKIPSVKLAFMRGTVLSPHATDVPCWIDRSDEVQALLSPTTDTTANYHIIEGPYGSGKSLLLERACHDAGDGVMYVKVPVIAYTFYDELAKAANVEVIFPRPWEIRSSAQSDQILQETKRVLSIIENAASELRLERGKPLVLVLDDTQRLVVNTPTVLELVQDFAERCAASGSVSVIFVSNEGAVATFLRRKHARSSLCVHLQGWPTKLVESLRLTVCFERREHVFVY
jgi:hypothetical protein